MKNYRAELTGVFGDPVDDNPTGVVEEAAFAAKNLNYRYLTIKVSPDDLQKAMESVRIIGAVNTVIHRDGKLYGENTDGKGFVIGQGI